MQKPEIYHYDKISSTNSELKRLQAIAKLPEFSIVISEYQTKGRGLKDNFWESEKGENLTFSILLYPQFIEVQYQFCLNFIITVAIIDVLKKELSDLKIKWTNDIYVNDKKIAGILIENFIMGDKIDYSIIGIGLNVNQINFISDAPNPISMKQLTNKQYNIEMLFNDITNSIINRYTQFVDEGIYNIRNEYHTNLYRNNGYYKYKDKNGVFFAKTEKVEDTGYLILIDEDGEKRSYAFKEVEIMVNG